LEAFAIVRHALQLSVLALGWLVTASAAAGLNTGSAGAGVQLMPSQPIERHVDADKHRRVLHQLAELQVGPASGVLSPEDLRELRSGNLPDSPENAYDLNDVEIEVRAPRGVPECPLQAQIPLGLAGLAWGARHPGQAWRLFLPVMPG
jgi:hypothetical protein